MPRPTSAVRASKAPQNGHATEPASRAEHAPQVAMTLVGVIDRLLADSAAGSDSVRIADVAVALRCVAALLENAGGRPIAGSAEVSTPVAPTEFNAAGEISLNAETLLSTLVSHRRAIERSEPDHAWLSRNEWFPKTGMRPERKDALALIDELIQAHFIDVRQQGAKGCWRQYRATREGARYVDRLGG